MFITEPGLAIRSASCIIIFRVRFLGSSIGSSHCGGMQQEEGSAAHLRRPTSDQSGQPAGPREACSKRRRIIPAMSSPGRKQRVGREAMGAPWGAHRGHPCPGLCWETHRILLGVDFIEPPALPEGLDDHFGHHVAASSICSGFARESRDGARRWNPLAADFRQSVKQRGHYLCTRNPFRLVACEQRGRNACRGSRASEGGKDASLVGKAGKEGGTGGWSETGQGLWMDLSGGPKFKARSFSSITASSFALEAAASSSARLGSKPSGMVSALPLATPVPDRALLGDWDSGSVGSCLRQTEQASANPWQRGCNPLKSVRAHPCGHCLPSWRVLRKFSYDILVKESDFAYLCALDGMDRACPTWSLWDDEESGLPRELCEQLLVELSLLLDGPRQ